MSAAFASRVMDAVLTTKDQYYKLVLAVGPARSGKTTALTIVAQQRGWARLNVNLRLSERLLELTQKQRKVRVAAILDETVRAENCSVVVLDNIELLFAPELEQDPLRLLQGISRNLTIIAAWPGTVGGGCLTYAEPGHPEARRYVNPQACIVSADTTMAPEAVSAEE
jgi:ATPase family associated with various cellular activities (AAA)